MKSNRITPPDLTEAEALRLVEELDLKCPQCGYALRGLGKLDCPECGLSIPPFQIGEMRERRAARMSRPSASRMMVSGCFALVIAAAYFALTPVWQRGTVWLCLAAGCLYLARVFRTLEREYAYNVELLRSLKRRAHWRVAFVLLGVCVPLILWVLLTRRRP